MSSPTLAEKTCTRCGETKPLSQFYRRERSADGRTSQCGSCVKAGVVAYRAKRKAEMGEAEWNRLQAKIVKEHRQRNPGNASQQGAKAAGLALARLRDAHPDEYQALLREERYKLGLDPG